ncbi:hypothetical protein Tco_0195550, partial [Tanacetum coccineum]
VDPHGFEGIHKEGHGERLSRSDEVLKLKNLKKDAILKLFKITYQDMYEHVGSEVISSQDGKVYKMANRDYAWLMISRFELVPLSGLECENVILNTLRSSTKHNLVSPSCKLCHLVNL